MRNIKKVLYVFSLLVFLLLLVYILYPKKAVHYSSGSWLGSNVTVCRCYGISKGITNEWLSEHSRTNGEPSYNLNENDYCVGLSFPFARCLITNIGVNMDAFRK